MRARGKANNQHVLKKLAWHLTSYVKAYRRCFRNDTFDGHTLGQAYIRGLIRTEAGKRNRERMNEET
ncbi:MAG: hypothetical protein EA400_06900, partial [Chromatiaceae bacterium]